MATVPPRGKKQLALPTKEQLGFLLGHNVLNYISNAANGVRDLVDKGIAIDERTDQRTELKCSPDDIKRSWSTEQLVAVEDFIANWSTEPEPPPAPPKPVKPNLH